MEGHLHFSREDLLTPTEVAAILRVRRTTALDYMRRGVVPARKIGRQWYSPRPLLDEYLDRLFESTSGR
ncbi:MAG: helix-turn-helix domain-containing protein [Actinobacteria bacterium]|nr:helix-turn-helix domain-containing protein [Actinomycetota bacterium]